MIAIRTEADVVEAVRAARATRRTLEIVGHGTKRGLGRATSADDILDCSALSGILSYEPEELIVTCLANTPVAEIESALTERHQQLGFEPADWGPLNGAPAGVATISGVLSADANGSAAMRYGRLRNHLLGYRAVNGFGEAYRGGAKVVKNVTGFDLPKLMCGAFGTLGILTEVTLRVFPKPGLSSTLMAAGAAPQAGLALLRQLWAGPLSATGLAYVPGQGALVRLDGASNVLAEKIGHLKAAHADHAFEETDPGIFASVANGTALQDATMPVWLASLPPTLAFGFIDAVKPTRWVADWAGGLLWLASDADPERVHSLAAQHEGRATLMRADEHTRRTAPVFPPADATRREITRAVKAAFDPLHLFNRGRMVEGL